MPYMLAPGARLYVGPHGQMEESLGACCASCAGGGPCATGLGATTKSLATRNVAVSMLAAAQPLTAGAGGTVGGSAIPGMTATSAHLLLYGALAGVAGLGVLFVLKRRRKGRR